MIDSNPDSRQTLASQYENLTTDRQPYLDRAYDVAALTLPQLIVRDGDLNQDLLTPYQSVGARGLTAMTSKVLMALFPPSHPFMRFQTDPFSLRELGENVRSEVKQSLAEIEQTVVSALEAEALRPHLNEAIKQLIGTGNCLFHLPEAGGAKVHKMDRYVVRRDPAGNILKIVIKECVSPAKLPEEVRVAMNTAQPNLRTDGSVDIYTGILLSEDGDSYEVYQEVGGHMIAETQGSYKLGELPWLALRMEAVTGTSYGYGYVAGHLGDLKSLETLMESLVTAAAASAKVVFLVEGTTDIQSLADAASGDVLPGSEKDVSTVQVNKAADMRVAYETVNSIKSDLQSAFLLNQSIQRKGERVTAAEIRFLAEELSSVLSGAYSLLSVEFQLPLVKLVLGRLTKEGKVPDIPSDVATPTIVTGLEGLAQGAELQRLDSFVGGVVSTFGPDVAARHIDVSDYLTRRATATGIIPDGLVRTAEEVAAEVQQQQAMQAMSQLASPGMGLAGKLAEVTQQNNNQQ